MCADRADDKRHAGVNVKCTPAEKAGMERAAREAGLSLSHYLRTIAVGGEMTKPQSRPEQKQTKGWVVHHVDDLGADPLGKAAGGA